MNNELLERIYLLEEPEIGAEDTNICIVEPEEIEEPDEESEEEYDD